MKTCKSWVNVALFLVGMLLIVSSALLSIHGYIGNGIEYILYFVGFIILFFIVSKQMKKIKFDDCD